MAYLLGIDIGTSGTKALICNARGKVLATASAPHTRQEPKPGFCLLYTSPSPRDRQKSRMPSSA